MTHGSLFLEAVIRMPAWPPPDSFSATENLWLSKLCCRCGVMIILKFQCEMWDLMWMVNWWRNSSSRNDYTHCNSKPQSLLSFNIWSPFVFISHLCYNLHHMTETRFSLRETLRYAWRVQWRDVGSKSQTLQCENSPAFQLVVRAYNNITIIIAGCEYYEKMQWLCFDICK